MPITINWDDPEHTILCTRTAGQWTWEEFSDCIHGAVGLMKEVDHLVYIINIRERGAATPHGDAINRIRSIIKLMPNNYAMTINVTETLYGKAIANIVLKVVPGMSQKIVFASSVEEAYEVIAAHKAKQSVAHGEEPPH